MDLSVRGKRATSALASFHGKIKEAIALVRSMSTEDKLKAVQYWNVVSDNLQDVVNSSADDISALQLQLSERENKILLQNPRAHLAGSFNRRQPPSSQGLALIRRREPSGIGGLDLRHKQNSAAVRGPDVVDHYLGSRAPVATTSGGHLTAPAIVDEYEAFNACKLFGDHLAESVAGAGLCDDPLGAEETPEVEGSGGHRPTRLEPVSRGMNPLPASPAVGVGIEQSRIGGEVVDATSEPRIISGVETGERAEERESDELFESYDFRQYLSFVKNKTGTIVLNFFTRQPKNPNGEENGGYVYGCNVCQRQLPHLAAFCSHFAFHCERLVCCKCGRTCHSKLLYRAHMISHSKGLLKCIECGRAFTTFSNLSRHMKTHTGERRFECAVCCKRFAERKDLQTHIRLHSGERPYQCSQCPARFIQAGALSTHMRHHNDEKTHLCDLCGKTFFDMAALKDHKLRHEDKKRFPCDSCSMAFNVRSDLRRHRRSHLPEKPHKCTECSKSFPRTAALTEHLNRHFGKRPHRCLICTKGYADRSAYNKHMKTHARDELRPPSPASPADADDPDDPPPSVMLSDSAADRVHSD